MSGPTGSRSSAPPWHACGDCEFAGVTGEPRAAKGAHGTSAALYPSDGYCTIAGMGPLIANRLGMASAVATVVFSLIYGVLLGVGLASRASPDAAIHDPWLAAMELMILVIAPAMVAVMGSLHFRARRRKAIGRCALFCMLIAALLTCGVHISLLLGSRASAQLAFQWPSIPYALDVVAWDVFFPISALLGASLVEGSGLARLARYLLIASGLLALAGLAGVPGGDMQLRDIGILGYAVAFPLAALALAALFRQGAASLRAASSAEPADRRSLHSHSIVPGGLDV